MVNSQKTICVFIFLVFKVRKMFHNRCVSFLKFLFLINSLRGKHSSLTFMINNKILVHINLKWQTPSIKFLWSYLKIYKTHWKSERHWNQPFQHQDLIIFNAYKEKVRRVILLPVQRKRDTTFHDTSSRQKGAPGSRYVKLQQVGRGLLSWILSDWYRVFFSRFMDDYLWIY